MGTVKYAALAALCAIASCPAPAHQCQLCIPSAPSERPSRPLQVEIETILDFSTAAHTGVGHGSVSIDPRTGARHLMGLAGIGGPAMRGTVTITGEPFRRISIDLPTSIALRSTQGGSADVTDIATDLPGTTVIGADGRLVFAFGGKLTVRNDAAGDFRGRIRITADYQ